MSSYLLLGIILAASIVNSTQPALADSSQIYLCDAGSYGSLSKVLTQGAGAVIHYAPQGVETAPFIGAESSVEADAFIAGSNMTTQKSSADYIAAQGRLRLAIDYAKTNLLPNAISLTKFSLHQESITGGALGTFGPGIYKTTAAMNMAANETITLTGGPTDTFVFISGEALTIGASSTVLLRGGAQAKNVYWVIGTFVGAKTIGASSIIVGNILVDGSLTIGADTHINGRVLVVNTVSYGAGSRLEVLPSDTTCSAALSVKSILFIDSTLVDATIGTFYSDTITAEVHIDNLLSHDTVTYSVDPPLPIGLSLNSATGVVSGIPTIIETQTVIITASSSGYVSTSETITIIVKASVVKSIFFTDTTLADATVGTPYLDTATAVGMIDSDTSTAIIRYSITNLPTELTFDTATGVISGTLPVSFLPETRTVTITATSDGYPSQILSYTFTIKAKLVASTVQNTTTPLGNTGSGGGSSSPTPTVTSAAALPVATAIDTPTANVPDVVASIIVNPAVPTPADDVVAIADTSTDVTAPLVIKKPINTLMMTAYFGNNSSKLDPKTKTAIKVMSVKLQKLNIATLTVSGYASAAGGVDNMKLSLARAKTLASLLIANGVKNKIVMKGLGVIPSGTSQAALALTRKSEIWVLLKTK